MPNSVQITLQGKVQASIAVKVCNAGQMAGSEVIQLYVSAVTPSTPRPLRELQGFAKIHLEPGEERCVDIPVDLYALSFWDEKEEMWCVEAGSYRVTVVGTAS